MEGKAFERKVIKQLHERDSYVIRLRDVPLMYGRKTKNTENVSDLISIKDDRHVYIETKVVNSKKKSLNKPRQMEEMARFKRRNPNTEVYVVIRYECLPRKEMHKMAKYDDLVAHFETGIKSVNCSLPWLTSWDEFLEELGDKKKTSPMD